MIRNKTQQPRTVPTFVLWPFKNHQSSEAGILWSYGFWFFFPGSTEHALPVHPGKRQSFCQSSVLVILELPEPVESTSSSVTSNKQRGPAFLCSSVLFFHSLHGHTCGWQPLDWLRTYTHTCVQKTEAPTGKQWITKLCSLFLFLPSSFNLKCDGWKQKVSVFALVWQPSWKVSESPGFMRENF